ncbi:MAG: 2-C-methyl-D-erythritol 4-phosphate cytidylyltransferase [bacterium]
MQADVVVVAAGQGRRLQKQIPKQFFPLAGKPILAHTLKIFEQHPRVEDIIIVGATDWLFHISTEIVDKFGFEKVNRVIAGGAERQYSVAKGIAALESGQRPVLIHDGVRPFVRAGLIDRILDGFEDADACIPILPCVDTIKEIEGGWIKKTIPRANLRRVQTPQAFKLDKLREAFQLAERKSRIATDDAALVEEIQGKIRWVEGEQDNIKITTAFDLKIANLILDEKNICE